MPPSAPEARRPAACYPQRICGILATENRCPTRPLRDADQARAAIQAALAQIGICLPGTITIRPARRGKDPLNLRASPPSLHGPYIQWTRTVNGKTVTRLLTRPSTRPTRPGSATPAGSAR
jgi:hypothetical protein